MASRSSNSASRTTKPKATSKPQAVKSAGEEISHDMIARRAYEKWCERGQPHGTDASDWFEAEQELRAEQKPRRKPRA